MGATANTALAWIAGFFFAFRLFITLILVWTFGADPQTGVVVTILLNLALWSVIAFSCHGGRTRREDGLMKNPASRWVLFFLGFTCVSLIWSSAVSLPAAGAFWCAMAADSSIILLILRNESAQVVAPALMKGYVIGASLVAVTAWLLPEQPDMRLGYTDLLGPNQIGYLCGFAFFFAQYLVLNKERKWKLAMVLLGVTLLRSLSKTTIIALLVSQTVLLLTDQSIRRRTKFWTVMFALLIVLPFWNLIFSYYDMYTNTGSQSENLTGRVGLWAIFLLESVQHPWIGHGFHSVWKVIPPYGPDQFEARHAHNELFQQFYAYGIVGVTMFMGIYGSFLRQVHKMARGPMKTFFFSLMLFILIRGVADTEPFDLSLPVWAILLLTALLIGMPTSPQDGVRSQKSRMPNCDEFRNNSESLKQQGRRISQST